MFTSMAVNRQNIIKIGAAPFIPTGVPVEADVIVGTVWTGVFVRASITVVPSSKQVICVRPTQDGIRVRAQVVPAKKGKGVRVIIVGTLEFAVTYKMASGLVGFTVMELAVSTFADLPNVGFRKGMQAEAELFLTATVWDTPSGPMLGGPVQIKTIVTQDEIITLIALMPAETPM